jgi:preprotein translocase subunit YajC
VRVTDRERVARALTISAQPKIQMPILFIFQQQGGSLIMAILPWVLIFGVFYFLLIVPQRKRQRELQETIANLKAGDKVITNGGIIGTITAVRDSTFLIRSGEKSILEISRAAISNLMEEEEKK